jgi:hypothetical protein
MNSYPRRLRASPVYRLLGQGASSHLRHLQIPSALSSKPVIPSARFNYETQNNRRGIPSTKHFIIARWAVTLEAWVHLLYIARLVMEAQPTTWLRRAQPSHSRHLQIPSALSSKPVIPRARFSYEMQNNRRGIPSTKHFIIARWAVTLEAWAHLLYTERLGKRPPHLNHLQIPSAGSG